MARLYNGVYCPVDGPAPGNVMRLDLGIIPMVREFHKNGILIDPEHFQRLDQKLALRQEEIAEKAYREAGRRFLISSPDQVARLVFREIGVKAPFRIRKTKSGRESTEEEILAAVKDQHPVISTILDYRGVHKLRTTYVGTLPKMVWEDGRLHTTFLLTRARTGRLASEEPNLQNIPVRTAEGRAIRAGFIARKGCRLVSGDLSQIEMRVAADQARDETMCDLIRRGLDIHTATAIALFLLPASAVELPNFKMEYRLPAKTLGFGVLYGVTPEGLQIQIVLNGGPFWTLEQCEKFIESWYGRYWQIREYMELQYNRVRQLGYTWDMFGRTRFVPEASSALRRIVNQGLRQSGNHPIQSGAGGMLKLAMAEIQDVLVAHFRDLGAICDPLLQVHDELIFEVSTEAADEFAGMLRLFMSEAVPLSIPVDSSAVVGENWEQLKD